MFAGTALLLVVVFAVAVFVEQGKERGGTSVAPGRPLVATDPARVAPVSAPSQGRADAPVTLVEFLDPACETCATFYPEVKRMLAANPDRLRIVVRHVPFHDGSEAVVRMLEAARLQEKYWPALEALLARQREWVFQHKVQPERALAVLGSIGLDVARLQADAQRDDVRARVAQDFADAKALRVAQTPEYFVNGRPLPTFGLEQLRTLVAQEVRK